MITSLPNGKLSNRKLSNRMILFLIAFPFAALLIIFSYLPLYGWIYSFFEYTPGVPLKSTQFVGLKYFIMAVTDGEVRSVLRNTLAISFLNLIVTPFPVILAVLMSEMRGTKYKKLIQTTTTLPNFISWVLVYSFFFAIFSNDGLLNQLIRAINPSAQAVSLLANNDIAWYFQVFVITWKTAGWNAIIYLAAIAGIDSELYDAASVDGAGRFRKIIHVTVPGLMPTYFVLLLLGIGYMLSNGFEQYFVFYNSLVADKLDVLDYYVYRVGLQMDNYAYATTIGIYKTVISVSLLFTANFVAKKVRGQSLF